MYMTGQALNSKNDDEVVEMRSHKWKTTRGFWQDGKYCVWFIGGYKVNEDLGQELNVNASGLDWKFGCEEEGK